MDFYPQSILKPLNFKQNWAQDPGEIYTFQNITPPVPYTGRNLFLPLSSSNAQVIVLKTKIIASSPITLWQIGGETMEIVTDFIFLGSKITADGDCSHEVKRHLLFGRQFMTKLTAY